MFSASHNLFSIIPKSGRRFSDKITLKKISGAKLQRE
jgi:hypothetical protein